MKFLLLIRLLIVKHAFIVAGICFLVTMKYREHILNSSMIRIDDEMLFNHHLVCFRDLLVIVLGTLIVRCYKPILRLRDRPVLWPFFLYLLMDFLIMIFMCSRFNLTAHPLTVIAVMIGLTQGVLLMSVFYLASSLLKEIRPIIFSAFFLLLLAVLLGDAVYFSYTNAHVETLLFYNLNYHSIWAFLSALKAKHVIVATLLLSLAFAVNRRALKDMAMLDVIKPRLIWAVGGASFFLLILIVVSAKGVELNNGFLSIQYQSECVRQSHRYIVAASPLFNLAREAAAMTSDRRMPLTPGQGQELSKAEATALTALGITSAPNKQSPSAAAHYKTIVLIVFESLHADFLHHYNPAIPAIATSFFDQLLRDHPHVDNFFTSAMPTNPGLHSIFLSQLRDNPEFSRRYHPESLFSLMKQQGLEGYFVSGVSGDYGDEAHIYPQIYKMDHYRAQEDLARNYQGASRWGFHDDIVFAEGLRILQERRDQATLLVLKTIDLHPPPYSGIAEESLPPEIRSHADYSIRSLYWINNCLAEFFRRIHEQGLWRNDTLFVITADHSPLLGSQGLARPQERRRLGRIPLIFVSAKEDAFKGLDPSRYASQIDIAPTLTQMMGIASPQYFLGKNLVNDPGKGFAIGFFNDTLYYERADLSFTTNMKDDNGQMGIRDAALRKWFNNMESDKMPGVTTQYKKQP